MRGSEPNSPKLILRETRSNKSRLLDCRLETRQKDKRFNFELNQSKSTTVKENASLEWS